MYLLFRYHNKNPSEIYWLPVGEKKILQAFISREMEDREKEAKAWQE